MKVPSRFSAVSLEQLPWSTARLPNGEAKGIQFQTVFNGGQGLPQVHFNRYEPHWREARHRHAEDEVLMLTEGELDIEGVVHRAPAVLFVGRGTLYGPLQAGPEGACFLRVAYTEDMIKAAAASATASEVA